MNWQSVLKNEGDMVEMPMDEEMPPMEEGMPMGAEGMDMGMGMPEEPEEEGSKPRNVHGGEEFNVDPENDELTKWFNELKKKVVVDSQGNAVHDDKPGRPREFAPRITNLLQGEGFRRDASLPRKKKQQTDTPPEKKDETYRQAAMRAARAAPGKIAETGKEFVSDKTRQMSEAAQEGKQSLGNTRFRSPVRTIRDKKTGKIKDVAIRAPWERTAQGRAKDVKEDYKEVLRRKPNDPYPDVRREYEQQKQTKANAEKQIEQVQSTTQNAISQAENQLAAIQRQKENLAFSKKQLPIEEENKMRQLKQRMQTLQNESQKKISELTQGMEENNKKLEENEKFLDPETNFLEDQYRTQRQQFPQQKDKLQSKRQWYTARNLGVGSKDQMQSPKKKEGWFSNVTNPFTSAMREHQSKLNTGSIAPDAKARKIVPPKKRKGKYQQ